MMIRSTLLRTLLCSSLLSVAASPALACACCKEPGDRFEHPVALESFHIDDLKALRTNGRADVQMTACGFNCLRGLLPPDRAYDAAFNVADTWSLTLTDGAASTLILTAALPAQFIHFATDPAPGSATGAYTPGGLYTELRFPLRLSGSGPGWTGGPTPVAAELILIGTGTACPDIASMGHWMLDVTGDAAATFRLYGTLAQDG